MEWKKNRRGRFYKLPADETELFLVPEKHLGLFVKVSTSDVRVRSRMLYNLHHLNICYSENF